MSCIPGRKEMMDVRSSRFGSGFLGSLFCCLCSGTKMGEEGAGFSRRVEPDLRAMGGRDRVESLLE